MAWTDEKRQEAIDMYTAANPTAANSLEIAGDVAEKLSETANGVRAILSKAGVYVKKETASAASGAKPKAAGDGTKAPRVSKEDSHAALTAAIEAAGHTADSEIISKLTGKAAVYFTSLFTK